MKILLFCLALLLSIQVPVFSQADSISVSLSSFTRMEDSSEQLYLAVFIRSRYASPVIIDNTQSWIRCNGTAGVKLISQYMVDSCFKAQDGSDCHPVFIEGADALSADSLTLTPFGSYSYLVQATNVSRLVKTESGQRMSRMGGMLRFSVELPYWKGGRKYIARSPWHYYHR